MMKDQLFSCSTVTVRMQEVATFSLSLRLLVIWCLLLGSKTFSLAFILKRLYFVFSFYWEPQGQLSWYLHRVSHMVRVGDLRDGMQKYLHNCSGSFFVSFCLVFEKWRRTYSVKLHKTSRQEDNVRTWNTLWNCLQ